MKIIRLFLLFATTLSFSSTIQVFSQANDEESFRLMETQVLKRMNEHRKSIGLNELQFDEVIYNEALKHSKNMANGIIPLSHDGFEGRAERLLSKAEGNAIAENVASGQTNAESAVLSWLGSDGHKQNIEGVYNFTGVGIAQGKTGELYFTQIFLLFKPIKK